MTHRNDRANDDFIRNRGTRHVLFVKIPAYRPLRSRLRWWHNYGPLPLFHVKIWPGVDTNDRTERCKYQLLSHFENEMNQFGLIKHKPGPIGAHFAPKNNDNNRKTR